MSKVCCFFLDCSSCIRIKGEFKLSDKAYGTHKSEGILFETVRSDADCP